MVPVTDVARIKQQPTLKLVRTPMQHTEFIAFNTEKAPFNDPRVRLAISQAIDFNSLISGVYNNTGSMNTSSLGPAVFGFNPNLKPYTLDIDNAKKLLTEAGYPDGFKANFYVADRKIRIKLA